MKKILLAVSVVALMGLAACGGADSKIKDYENAFKKEVELLKKGDTEGAQKQAIKIQEIATELSKEDLSVEQQKELMDIATKYEKEMLEAGMSAAGSAF